MDTSKRLDNDYFDFISLSHEYYTKISDEPSRNLCEKWLVKILGERVDGIPSKRNRNMFMMQLLMQMQLGEMTGFFSNPPDDNEQLPSFKKVFENMDTDHIKEPKSDGFDAVMDDDKGFSDERSADARTFYAFRHLPNNQGMYGFISLTLDAKKNDDVNLCNMDETDLGYAKALRRLHSANMFNCTEPTERDMEDFYMNNVEQKISGNVYQMLQDLAGSERHCWKSNDRTEDFHFNDLLKQIDEEIKGQVSQNHKLVKFLMSRLGEDLKKEPKMKFIMKLPPQQKQLRILEILRKKLILRKQEKQQKILLTKMEERIMQDTMDCSCREDEQSNLMWSLAITRPLKESIMKKIHDNYPPEIVPAFVELLTNDRKIILENGLQQQQDLVESMRAEVYRDIQAHKAAYNKAREAYREWNEILSNVEELIFDAGATDDEDEEEVPSDGSENLLKDMMLQMNETENLIIAEARRGEDLTGKIYEMNSWSFSADRGNDDKDHHVDDKCKDWSWEGKQEVEILKKGIADYESLISGQMQRIKRLESGD